MWQFTEGSLGSPTYYSVTRHQTISLLSSGFLQYTQGGAGYNCYQSSCLVSPFTDLYSGQSTYSYNYTDQSILDFELTEQGPDQTPICETVNETEREREIQSRNVSCSYLFTRTTKQYDPTSSLLMGYILYYPNSSLNGTNVMAKVKNTLKDYSLLRNQKISNMTMTSRPVWVSLETFADLSTACWIDPDLRVIGFATLNDLLLFSQNNLSAVPNSNIGKGPILQLWGAISFEETDANFENQKFQYSMLYEAGYMNIDMKDIWLQDLVEQAALKVLTGKDTLPITPTFKLLPSKCWIRPPQYIYSLLQNWLSLMITIGFFLMPTTFLILIVQEKQLKLREYLYIMGVTDLFLKFSWMTFFLMFLIPMTIITSVIVYFLPSHIFAASDPSILFVILILYTVSQLCWVYLLSTVMQNPARAGFIVGFFNIFFSAFSNSAYIFGQGKLTGSFLVISRILSLHSSVPFSLAMCYFVGWEALWTGTEWRYFFKTPTTGDGYNGFGEGICWMIGDSFLYLFLAWYFQHLFPGDYGVKYPFYFIFLPSFWFPKKFGQQKIMKASEESRADIELFGQSHETGVMLESLTKFYNKDKVGIDKLSVSFFKNQVTAFLGENGAGKTTTMNILVGLINPTDGDVWIQGMNVSKRMSEIRKIIAFVPQYDILYPSMTVEEHIQFFGWLQGLSKAQVWKSMDLLLKTFDLIAQKKTLTTNLSGGQKRKVSILTAYIGSPEVIILDEPTSGVDPYSRKAIWEIIAQRRKYATTILSTHYMQEADILGDRIAIISSGKLQCVGSGMYLKNRYGQGYRLTIAIDPNRISSNQLGHFLQTRIPESKLVQESGNDKTYTIPVEIAQSDNMVKLLQSIEECQAELGIVSFGVTEPSLEEVFFAATGARHNITGEKPHHAEGIKKIVDVERRVLHKPSNLFTQFATLFIKRILLTIRSPSVFVLQVLLPLILVGVMLLIDNGFNTALSDTTIDFYTDYRENVFFFQDHGGMGKDFLNIAAKYGLSPLKSGPSSNGINLEFSLKGYPTSGNCSCDSYCPVEETHSYPSGVIPSKDLVYPLDSSANASDWILHANQTNHWIIGGFEFYQLNSSVYKLNEEIRELFNLTNDSTLNQTTIRNYSVIWTTPDLNMAMLNAFNNMLLRLSNPDWSIILSKKVANLLPPSQNIVSQVTSMAASFLSCIFLIMAFIFATFGMANIVQLERSRGLKRMQFIAGANPVPYWCANLAWDIIQFMFTVALTFILLGTVKNPFNNETFADLGELTFLLLPFAFGTMAFTYLMTFVFETPQALNRMISLIGFVALLIAIFIALFCVLNDLGISDYSWANYISYICCLFPYYYVSESVVYMSLYQSTASSLNNQLPGISYDTNLLDFNHLGRRAMEGWISAILLFAAVIFLEYKTYSVSSGKVKSSTVSQNFRNIIDADVLEEEQKVSTGNVNGDPLVVHQVYKVYPKQTIPAVNGVSFSIPRGQCFGLLGINGAGKTSLFRILAGFSGPTCGTASIESMDIRQNFRSVGIHMGYCPQENTLFDQLTPKEHLMLIGYLRGIPKKELSNEVERLMLQVGLDTQSKKHASQMSGGNQRKLQFAIALLDYRPVIFLDEPTTGMDPSARRQAWNSIIDAVDRGCSIVLTSHSMEECEVLCHRLVIMVLGNFSCIGSVQYLKNKFGNKYTFKVKLSPFHEERDIVQLKEYFHQYLPHGIVIEEHSTLLVYEITADGLRISALFQILCNSKKQYPKLIEDFTTSQVSLEHVFVNMAERQQLLQAGLPVASTVQ